MEKNTQYEKLITDCFTQSNQYVEFHNSIYEGKVY